MTSEPKDAAGRLRALLDQAAAAARSGGIERLAELGEAMDQAAHDLAAAGSSRDILADLRVRADRNGALIAAARRGIADAQDRLRAIGGVARGLSVYTQDGRGLTHARAATTVERRA